MSVNVGNQHMKKPINMENKKEETCPETALFHVPWGGRIIQCCLVHANGLAKVSQAMGAPLSIRQVLTDAKCEMPNDLDEYKS